MKLSSIVIILVGFAIAGEGFSQESNPEQAAKKPESKIIQLPDPSFKSETSIEEALNARQSVRAYSAESLSLTEISQMLWAAQGITRKKDTPSSKWNEKYEWQGGNRTAPSAGGLYPMELYLLAGNVEGLDQGVYKYIVKSHSLIKVIDGDKRADVREVSLKQKAITEGAAVIVMAAVYERTSIKYGARSEKYIFTEVGHIGQNIYLQGASLGIGTVMIGAYKDDDLKRVLNLPDDEKPMAVMPIGKMLRE